MVKSLSKNKIESNLETITIEPDNKDKVHGAVAPRFVRLSDPWLQYKPVASKPEKR